MTKIFSNVTGDKALDILEAARIDSQYSTIPLKDIKRRALSCGLTGYTSGTYIDVWAVDLDGKYKMCSCLARNDEGARVQMGKYLEHRCHVNPADYALFTDFMLFWDYRMCKIGVRTGETVEQEYEF